MADQPGEFNFEVTPRAKPPLPPPSGDSGEFGFEVKPRNRPAASQTPSEFQFEVRPRNQPHHEYGLTTSLIKTATGTSLDDLYKTNFVSRIDKYIPDWVKQVHGGEYASKLAAEISRIVPQAGDFFSSPGGAALGLLHIFPQTRLIAGAIDVGVAAYQATQIPQSVREARRDPSPENVARALVDVGSVGAAVVGGSLAAKSGVARLPASSSKAAALRAGARGAAEWFAGVSKEQQIRAIGQQTIGHRRATMEHEMAQAQELMTSEWRRVAGLPTQEKHNIIHDIEQGQGLDPLPGQPKKTRATMKQRDPQNQWIAETMTKLLDDEWDKVIAVAKNRHMPDITRHFYETYFPRFFKDPNKSQGWVADWYSKKPYSGRETFRQHRTHPTLADAQAAGLELITDNPVELALLKLKELKKFRTAQEAFQDLRDRGMLHRIKLGTKVPDGWATIDDKTFRVGPRGIGGDWIAPAPVAKTINAYLSPGLSAIAKKQLHEPLGTAASALVNLTRGFNSGTNIVNVAFSGFHALLEAGVSTLNASSLALKQGARGEFGKAGVSLAKSFGYAPIEDLFVGSRFRKEYKQPGSYPALAPLIEAYKKGSGRVRMETVLKDNFSYRNRYFDKAWEGIRREAEKVGAAPVVDVMRGMWNFTMETLVPNIKAGAFARLAKDEMERIAPQLQRLSPQQALDLERSVYSKLSDAMDDRHGQMIYDNLYWPNAWKDLMFLSTHFLGWTYGSLRAAGGGVLDIARQPVRKMLGREMELSHRAAWIMSLPFVYGMINATYQYLASGKPPGQLEDFIFPQNGRTRADGTPERDAFPVTGYLRDYYEWLTRPMQTASNKLSNSLIAAWDIFVTNKDYLGRDIADPDDPEWQQMLSRLRFIGERGYPISVQNVLQSQRMGEGSTGSNIARSAAGIRTSPAYAMRSPLENYIIEREPHRVSAVDVSDYERKEESRRLMEGLLSGKLKRDDIAKSEAGGKITASDRQKIVRDVRMDPWSPRGLWGRQFERLSPKQALAAWRLATDKERQKLVPLMARHLHRAYRQIPDPAKRKQIEDSIQKELNDFRARRGGATEAPPQ